jgi:hypothetical protein
MYHALKQELREIRVLEVHSARKIGHPLIGTLRHVRLEEASFSALSYVWGDEDNDRSEISIFYEMEPRKDLASKLRLKRSSSYVHSIASSLSRALRHLRKKHSTITIWTDFLCINQSDKREKNWQIPLMQTIYSEAKEVHAWLGPRWNDDLTTIQKTDAAFDVSKKIWAIADRIENSPNTASEENWLVACLIVATSQPSADPRQQFYVGFATALRRAAYSDPSVQREIASIETLSHNDYFARMWILQETGRARKLVFHYGHRQAPHRHILLALALANSMHSSMSRTQTDVMSTSFDTRFQGCLSARTTCLHRISLREVLSAAYYSNPPSQAATNPRDYIYARLGLAENPSGIEVRYEQSVAEVFTDASGFLLLEGFLDILVTFRPYRFQRKISDEGFPSWAYDWSRNSQKHFQRYNAALGTSQRVSIIPYHDGKYKQILSMGGFNIGDVVSTNERFSDIALASGLHKGTIVLADLRAEQEEMTAEKRDIILHNIKYAYEQLNVDVSSLDIEDLFRHRSLPLASFWCWWVVWIASLVHMMEEAEVYRAQGSFPPINIAELIFREDSKALRDNPNMNSFGTKTGILSLANYYRWSMLASQSPGQNPPKRGVLDRLAESLYRSAWGMRPAVLGSGRYGYVPEDTKPNDKVVIFNGVKAPLVIRKYSENAYSIIGPAHICGVMHGEAMAHRVQNEVFKLV